VLWRCFADQGNRKVNLDPKPVGCLQSGMRFFPWFLALVGLAILGALDILVRLRLKKVGEQSRPFQGACLTTRSISDYEGSITGRDGQFI
jgi:hypothetical protein